MEQMITAELAEFRLGIGAGRRRHIQVDDMLPAPVDDRRGGLLVNHLESPSDENEVILGQIRNRRRECTKLEQPRFASLRNRSST